MQVAARELDGARRRRSPAFLTRVGAAVVAVVMLVGVLRAGASYVYCPMMKIVMDAPCCSGDRRAEHEASDAAQLGARDCCEHHILARLPSAGATSAPPHLLAAPLVAVLPAPTLDPHRSAPDARVRFDHEGRAGPMASARHCAELMVSLS